MSLYEGAVKIEMASRSRRHIQNLAALAVGIQVASTFWNTKSGVWKWILVDLSLGSSLAFVALYIIYHIIIHDLQSQRITRPLDNVEFQQVLRLPSLKTIQAFALSSFLFALRGLLSSHASFNRQWILRFGHQEPNENIGFILVYHVLLGCGYAWYRSASDKDRLRFPLVKRPLWFRLKSRASAMIKNISYLSFIALLGYMVFYFIFSRQIYSLVGFVFKISKVRTFYRSYFDMSLLFHTFMGGFVCMSAWEWNDQLMQAIWAEVVSTNKSPDPYNTLLSGLNESKSYYKHLAYAELADFVRNDPMRRADVYNDVVVGGRVTTWPVILKACQSTLDELTTSVAKFGQGKSLSQPAKQPPTIQEAARRAAAKADPTIFLPTKPGAVESVFSAISRDGLARRPTPTTTAAAASTTSSTLDSTPFLLQNNLSAVPAFLGVDANPVAQVSESVTTMNNTVSDIIWKYVQKFLTLLSQHPRTATLVKTVGSVLQLNPAPARARRLFANAQLYIWASETLSYLIVHSRKEDKYGVVANDLPQVLESTIKTLDSIEKYISNARLAGANQEGMCPPEAGAICTAIRTFVYAVVEAYYEYLPKYYFSPVTSKRLAEFTTFAI
ncbi:hypothetical protein SmJEL517_g06253 [Synchytrium microbalum]|uniref:Nucleoporin NDC1 n=1 Tax=Synchytrium microbalum TaxID=1806994 RepID=A0A507BW75_9FUNG|nr:uncharacterized protein SmJEL517_g06253 [Synchytrium microbalum]TPX30104.1 hypothetical protein SmJEL517_g06253 [Synchytrium microbalum]